MSQLENQLSRYGAFSKGVPGNILAPGSKLFIVSDSDDTTVGPFNIANEFPVDRDGLVRVYTTIQAAVNAARSNAGDVILVLPNYDQSLTAADSWNVAGVQIIGLGQGLNRPTIRMTGASGTVDLAASNIKVSNLRFLAAADAVTRGLDLDTGVQGLQVDNCLFTFNATGNDFVTTMRVGAKRSIVENNVIAMEDTTGHNFAISLLGGDADYTIIRNNYIAGNFDSSVIGQDTSDTADTNLTGIQILNNTIVNGDTTSAMHIRFSAGYNVRGIVAGNRIASYDTGSAIQAQDTAGGVGGIRFIDNRIRTDSGFDTTVGG